MAILSKSSKLEAQDFAPVDFLFNNKVKLELELEFILIASIQKKVRQSQLCLAFNRYSLLINRVIVWSIKCQKIVKNDHWKFIKPKFTCSNGLFCVTNSSKAKNAQLTFIDEEKSSNYSHLRGNNRWACLQMTGKQLIDYHSSCRSIFCWSIHWLIVLALLLADLSPKRQSSNSTPQITKHAPHFWNNILKCSLVINATHPYTSHVGCLLLTEHIGIYNGFLFQLFT